MTVPALLLLCFGDMNFSGAQLMHELAAHGYDAAFPFAEVQSTLATAAIRIANLEGPLTFADWSEASANKAYRFRQLPVFANAIHQAGVDIVLLGNNHIYDAGEAGLRDTKRALRDAGVAWVPPPEEGPLVVTARGYTFKLWNADLTSDPGAHPWAVSLSTLSSRLAQTKSAVGHVTVVFVHLHEDARKPEVTRALRAAGASWVVYGGNHVAGHLEVDGTGGAHTGLGDLVFGCECSDGAEGKSWGLRIGPHGLTAEEHTLQPGRAERHFVATIAN